MSCLNPIIVYNKQFKTCITTRCGKCMECKRFYAREWSLRCVLEASVHPEDSNYFCTFTYNDDCIPYNFFYYNEKNDCLRIPQLVKKDYQNFLKRLRSRGAKFRYFLAGEYGDKFERPHFHIVFFGLDKVYLSQLKLCWNFGFIDIKPFLPGAGYYVAGYCQKKLYGQDKEKESVFRIPSFNRCSLNPPLGFEMFLKLKKLGKIKLNDKGYEVINFNGFDFPIPRSFNRKLGKKTDLLLLHEQQKQTLQQLNSDLLKKGLNYYDFLTIKKNLNYNNIRKESI